MRWPRFVVLVLIATILQTSLIDIITVTTVNIRPDLLLILLVFFAINYDPIEVVIASFSLGFAADLIGPTMGPQTISFGLLGTLLADLHRVMAIRKTHHQVIAIFIIGFLTAVLAFILTFLKAEPTAANTYTELFFKPLYSAIVGPFLFLPVAWWMRIKKRKTRRF
jgi:rod shape-determining protein MreD